MRRWRAAWIVAATMAAGAARAGTVKGVVRYGGRPPATLPLAVTKDAATCGVSVPDESLVVEGGRLAGAVVSVKGAPAPAPTRATLDQRRCRYVPHVLALPVGSTLEVRNGDALLHSVHGWEGRRSKFEVVTPDQAAQAAVRLERPGTIQVRCDVHAWMSAWVVVVDVPAAVTGSDGAFAIGEVPAGTYTVTAWHERAGERSAAVTVPAQGEATVELTLGE